MTPASPARRVAEIAERLKAAGDDYVVLTGFSPGMTEHFTYSRADIALLLSDRETLETRIKELEKTVADCGDENTALETENEALEIALRGADEENDSQKAMYEALFLTARREAGEAMRERCNQVKVETIELCRDAMCCDCMAGVEYENCYHIHAGGYTRPCGAVVLRSVLARAISVLSPDTQGRGDGG